MGHTITIRLNPDLADRVDRQAKMTGECPGKIIRDQLVKARKGAASQSFIRLAGTVAEIEPCRLERASREREHLSSLAVLAKRYADRQSDLAGLCLVRMSELHARHSVITVDREDFRVYRRNRRDTIPLICPPVR